MVYLVIEGKKVLCLMVVSFKVVMACHERKETILKLSQKGGGLNGKNFW